MRALFLFASFLITTVSYSQVSSGTIRVDSGKYEFKLQSQEQKPDYTQAFRILTNQIKLDPSNTELRYFLGYTIDRLNADNGEQMLQLKKEMTIKASEQFEAVNQLEPLYQGELYISDPYSKITAVWGSLAQAYLNRKMPDSAAWAFKEGKKRGGFIEPILEYNRQLLNSCVKNSILITYGDNITIPIWYLQTAESFRTDVTVVDANLLNTTWYAKYLKNEKSLKLSLTNTQIDTIDYVQWKPKQMIIRNPKDKSKKFSWSLRPTYDENYILKGDRILLDVFQQNYFNREIYFTSGSDSTYNLFLDNYLLEEGLVSKVVSKQFDPNKDVVSVSKNLKGYSIQNLKTDDIKKSRDAILVLNNYRWIYYSNIYTLLAQGNYPKAKELITEMKQKFDKEKLPFISKEQEEYFEQLRLQVELKLPLTGALPKFSAPVDL